MPEEKKRWVITAGAPHQYVVRWPEGRAIPVISDLKGAGTFTRKEALRIKNSLEHQKWPSDIQPAPVSGSEIKKTMIRDMGEGLPDPNPISCQDCKLWEERYWRLFGILAKLTKDEKYTKTDTRP